jgi:hypothetical protein
MPNGVLLGRNQTLKGEIQKQIIDLTGEPQEKTVVPSMETVVVKPDVAKRLTKVTVLGVTSEIDENISPMNIRKGKTILGVEGNLEPDKPDQSKVVIPSVEEQVVRADTGYELASVTIEGVTSDIDENIQADNIRYGVEILGVVGSMEQKEDLDAELTEQDALLDVLEHKVNVLPIKEDIDEDLTTQESLISDIQKEIDNLPEPEIVDLSQATATESDVAKGKTFFSGNDEIKTGTLEVPDLSATTATTADVMQGKKFYNAQGEFVEGSYVSESKAGQILDGTVVSLTANDLRGATALKQYALSYCQSLQSVEIPNTVIKMEQGVFSQDRALISVTFEAGSQLTTIGSDVFRWCSKLELAEIPDKVTLIETYAFYGCTELKKIRIPASVTRIRQQAFYGCSSVEELTFAEGSQLTQIDQSAFYQISDSRQTKIDVDLSPCTQLTYIGNSAFGGASKIKNMTLPVNVTTIENNALPASGLETLTVLATTPPTLGTHSTMKKLTAVYIPKGTLSAYESATNWSAFTGKFVELEA